MGMQQITETSDWLGVDGPVEEVMSKFDMIPVRPAVETLIRPGRFSDMEALLGIAAEFHQYAELGSWGLGFNRDLFANVLAHFMTNNDCCLFMAEVDGQVVGTIAGSLLPWYMDLLQITATANWWFVRPASKGDASAKLLLAFETWAKVRGAKIVSMANFQTKRIVALERLYQSKGYRPLEVHFAKEL